VSKMLEIMSALLQQSDARQACCGWQLGSRIENEVQILEDTLNALGEGNTDQASSLLGEYANQLVAPECCKE